MPTKTFSIRLTPAEIAALRDAAGGQGASRFAREAVLAAVAGRRLTRRRRERDRLHRALAEVQATLAEVADRLPGAGRYPLDRASRLDAAAAAAEIAQLRTEITTLVSAVLRLGRRLDEAAEA